jgi:hypothetical protein|eukprot:COSAG01_NODE_9231_length_2512_cov_5.002487_2_plen_66_part_00
MYGLIPSPAAGLIPSACSRYLLVTRPSTTSMLASSFALLSAQCGTVLSHCSIAPFTNPGARIAPL